MVANLLDLLQKVPDVVWAAVIAAILTLSGVLLTTLSNFILTILKFKHDFVKQDHERNMALRRQVYLDAVEAITGNYLSIMKISDLTYPDSEISKQFASSAGKINMVYVIGTTETVRTISELNASITKEYLKLTAERLPLVQRRNEIKTIDNQIKNNLSQRNQMMELFKNLKINRVQDEEQFDMIEKYYKIHESQISKLDHNFRELIEKNQGGQKQLHINCMESFNTIRGYFPDAIGCIRKEMGLSFNEREFRKIVDLEAEESRKAVQDFMEKIKPYS